MSSPPLCVQIGILHGLIVGFLFGLWQFQGCCTAVSWSDLAWMMVLLVIIAMVLSLFVLCILRRYLLASVFGPVFVNAVLVTVAVVLVLRAIGPSPASILLGLIVGLVLGLLVGWLLCRLCDQRFDAIAVPRG